MEQTTKRSGGGGANVQWSEMKVTHTFERKGKMVERVETYVLDGNSPSLPLPRGPFADARSISLHIHIITLV